MNGSRAARWARWRRSVAAQGLATALAACLVQVAHAAPPLVAEAEPSESVKAQARALFQEGNSLLDSGEYRRALERFEQARSLWDNPKIELNIATTQHALGRSAAAANAYALYLEKSARDSPSRAEAAQILGVLTLKTGRLVLSNLDGVKKVLLDGVELSVDEGREIWVDVGEHVLIADRRSGRTTQHAFRGLAAEVLRVNLDQSTEEPRAAARTPPAKSDTPDEDTPDEDTPDEDTPAPEPPDSVLGLSARVDVDAMGRGAVAAAGIGLTITDHLRLTAGALIGASKGGWVGVDYLPWRGEVRPFVGVAAPTFYVDSLYAGIAAHCGIGFRFAPRVVPFVHVAVVHFPVTPSGYVKTVIVPAAGIEVPL